jgi:hypothetical protein
MAYGRGQTDHLFNTYDWYSVEQNQRKNMEQEIETYHGDRLLNTADDALIAYFVDKYRMDVPQLDRDKISADQEEVQMDVSRDPMRYISDPSKPFYIKGTEVQIEVPFTGEQQLFQVQPTTYTLNPPRAEARQHNLLIRIRGTNMTPEQVRQEFDRTLDSIDSYLSTLRANVEGFNKSIASHVSERIKRRKEKLLKDRNLVANLGFAMKPREGAATYASPQVRKKLTPAPPAASSAPYAPEPILPDAEYSNILGILDNMVHIMEYSPAAFANADEETIRPPSQARSTTCRRVHGSMRRALQTPTLLHDRRPNWRSLGPMRCLPMCRLSG